MQDLTHAEVDNSMSDIGAFINASNHRLLHWTA
jgi:hypothetical protein